ncbi:MAG: DUF1028 domain-containing protein, partial [Bacteroidota bacterium]
LAPLAPAAAPAPDPAPAAYTAAPADSFPPLPSRSESGAGPAFAVAAYDSASSTWGIACAAAEIACGARDGNAVAGAGAVVSLGTGPGALGAALAALRSGASPDSAIALLEAVDPEPAARQTIVIGPGGAVAGRSGKRLPGASGILLRPRFACAGHGLRSEETLQAMATAFASRAGELGARLVAALEAGERDSGYPFAERKRDASAALLLARAAPEDARGSVPGPGSDRLADLRVDADADPVGALGKLYARFAETFLPAAHARYGDAARRRGDDAMAAREYAAAEAGFRAAVGRGPKDADALNELAWFLATRGGAPDEALRFAEAAVTARPGDPNLLDTLAEAAYRAGNLERAVDAAERAVRLARGNARYEERLRAFRAARAALAPSSR